MWDPRRLTDQIGRTTTLTTSFLDHKGVLGIIQIPVLTEKATAPPPTRTPQVHTLRFQVPEHDMETWHSKVAVDSVTTTALASAMARTLLGYLSLDDNQGQHNTLPSPKGVEAAILSIASDLQTILGEAMPTATAISPQKQAAPKKNTLPQQLWSKSVRQDADKIRWRVKTLRRLASLAARHPEDISYDNSPPQRHVVRSQHSSSYTHGTLPPPPPRSLLPSESCR